MEENVVCSKCDIKVPVKTAMKKEEELGRRVLTSSNFEELVQLDEDDDQDLIVHETHFIRIRSLLR